MVKDEITFSDLFEFKDDKIVGFKVVDKSLVFDLHTPLSAELVDGIRSGRIEVKPVSIFSDEGVDIMRHSCAHALAQAVKRLFPDTKLSVGPTTEVGFFYDFYRQGGFTEEDLKKIEDEMRKIKGEALMIERYEMRREEAIKMYMEMGEDFKVKILEDIDDEVVSFYRQGEFFDLCRGPHVISTDMLGEFKLTSISAVHFRGDENAPMLTRIYGVAFPTKQQLDQYFRRIEELKKRDHRKLGRELELFLIDEDNIGPGLVIWLPKGARVRRIIEDFLLEIHEKRGYKLVNTPHIAKLNLWKTSGHLDMYGQFMFPSMDLGDKTGFGVVIGTDRGGNVEGVMKRRISESFESDIGYSEGMSYQLKPMNCPFHIAIFKSKTRSYRELPLKFFEFGTVYRYERSGVLHGLLRVRGFTQDDAHIFLRLEDIEDEVSDVLDIVKYVLSSFGFSEYFVYLSTRPSKRVGTDDEWDFAESALRALRRNKINFELDPGEGVFYGPKIDVKVKDTLGRVWQCSTIQLDFNLPRRFSAFYVDAENRFRPVYIIHRAILGSFERFFAVLIEHLAGNFPPWLSPVQCVLIPVTDSSQDYALFVLSILDNLGIRCEFDSLTGQRLSKRIRNWEVRKVPFMLVLGDKEKNEKSITIREKGKGIKTLSFDDGINYLIELCKRGSGE